MSSRDDEGFRVRLRPPRAKGAEQSLKFVDRVLALTAKAGATRRTQRSLGRKSGGAKRGRGYVVSKMLGHSASARTRRVIIKTRLVVLKRAGPRSVQKHLRYIEREGVGREGERGRAYGPIDEATDISRFEERGREDRHQFRFIVSPEDAIAIGDLKPFTRTLMTRMEADLGTKLEWVAVDHWDTDNPHTHIVLRGKDESGHDLVIARDYISHGMRLRAGELATDWLGPRTESEIRHSLQREVTAERWTSLDAEIQRALKGDLLELRSDASKQWTPVQRSLVMGRLSHLKTMELADEQSPGVWKVAPQTEPALRAMGERGDIIRTMQRTFSAQRRDYAIFDPQRNDLSIVGRLASKGQADELSDRSYMIVDSIDGRAHYVALPANMDVDQWPVGGIVEVKGQTAPRTVDRTIVELADDGIYRTEKHLKLARVEATRGQDAEVFVGTHVRRLEALRRAGMVERMEAGVWKVPSDLAERGRRYDAQRLEGGHVQLLSQLPIERQTRAIGATWLDRQLTHDPITIADSGFGSETRNALRQRLAFLVDEGFADRWATKIVLRPNLLVSLRDRELDSVSKSIAAESGLSYRRTSNGQRVSGIYRRSLMLNSGRFAMIDDGSGFSLVPWRPVIERHIGRELSGVVNGASVSWAFSRSRSPAL